MNRTANPFLIIGALGGMTGVILGAFGAHALKPLLGQQMFEVYHIGVEYQFYHALALLLVGMLSSSHDGRALRLAGWSFSAGIALFSGSLYLLATTGIHWLGVLTPFGGIAFLLGWGALIRAVWPSR